MRVCSFEVLLDHHGLGNTLAFLEQAKAQNTIHDGGDSKNKEDTDQAKLVRLDHNREELGDYEGEDPVAGYWEVHQFVMGHFADDAPGKWAESAIKYHNVGEQQDHTQGVLVVFGRKSYGNQRDSDESASKYL